MQIPIRFSEMNPGSPDGSIETERFIEADGTAQGKVIEDRLKSAPYIIAMVPNQDGSSYTWRSAEVLAKELQDKSPIGTIFYFALYAPEDSFHYVGQSDRPVPKTQEGLETRLNSPDHYKNALTRGYVQYASKLFQHITGQAPVMPGERGANFFYAAHLYYHGMGVEQDVTKALKLYSLAYAAIAPLHDPSLDQYLQSDEAMRAWINDGGADFDHGLAHAYAGEIYAGRLMQQQNLELSRQFLNVGFLYNSPQALEFGLAQFKEEFILDFPKLLQACALYPQVNDPRAKKTLQGIVKQTAAPHVTEKIRNDWNQFSSYWNRFEDPETQKQEAFRWAKFFAEGNQDDQLVALAGYKELLL